MGFPYKKGTEPRKLRKDRFGYENRLIFFVRGEGYGCGCRFAGTGGSVVPLFLKWSVCAFPYRAKRTPIYRLMVRCRVIKCKTDHTFLRFVRQRQEMLPHTGSLIYHREPAISMIGLFIMTLTSCGQTRIVCAVIMYCSADKNGTGKGTQNKASR